MMLRIILLVILAMPSSALAQWLNGNRLYSDMLDSKRAQASNGGKPDLGVDVEKVAWLHTMGYITGVADAFGGTSFCVPKNIPVGRLMDIIFLYLEANPNRRKEKAAALVVSALSAKFPCPKG